VATLYTETTPNGKLSIPAAARTNLRKRLPLQRHNAMHCYIHAASPVRLMTTGLGAELFRFRSPLLSKSLLVSFPPLSYMLKLSG